MMSQVSLISKVLFAATWIPHLRFVRDTKRPEQARARVWRDVHRLIAGSPFWQKRGLFAHLDDYELTDYETYREALEQTYSKTRSVLNGEQVLYWSESSGSSGKRKIFPLTKSYQKQFQATTPPLIHSFVSRFPGFMRNPVLYFASTLPAEKSPAGIDVGFISNFNYRNIPPFLQKHYAFPLEVFRDSDTFFKWGPLYALATDLSALIAITPSMVEQFAQRIEAQLSSYWPYLEGKSIPPAPLPPLKVSPERLATLRQALGRHPFRFREVWPGLQFVCCWKGATCGMQLPRIKGYLEGVSVIDATYSATEGWMNVPLESDALGGPLHPGAHIVEFLPLGAEPGKASLKQCWQLTRGADYEIVLTTAMGFVRYRLFDVVRCTGFFNRSPIIEFRHKSGNMISLGHTRVTEALLVEAMSRARFEPAGNWFFGPDQDGSRIVLYCEREPGNAVSALAEIDRTLCQENVEYDSDIRNGLLKPLAIRLLPTEHGAWRRTAAHAQTKPSILRQTPP